MHKLRAVLCLLLFAGAMESRAGDFADAVVAYAPAPGQFVNNAIFNNPARALGAPIGAGTTSPENIKIVSLGGFGGSITLRFFETVRDDPCNPLGLDAIVFGNAFWVGNNSNRKWLEAGVIEISRDLNGNGIADDPWFVIPGSHIFNTPPTTTPANQLMTQAWDNNPGTPTPPANVGWYPSAAFYPGFPSSYMTTTIRLPSLFDAQIIENPNGLGATVEGIWGYADASPTLLLGDTNADNVVDAPALTPGEFYTRPDNPFAVGVTAGSGGGDAFDIAWAIDPVTGAAAELDGFDFIRISSGANHIAGALGEVSVEIGGVAGVRGNALHFDRNGDARMDVEDVYAWELSRGDIDGNGAINERDRKLMLRCARRDELVF